MVQYSANAKCSAFAASPLPNDGANGKHSHAETFLLRSLMDNCKHEGTNSQKAFHSYQHIALIPGVGTMDIYPEFSFFFWTLWQRHSDYS